MWRISTGTREPRRNIQQRVGLKLYRHWLSGLWGMLTRMRPWPGTTGISRACPDAAASPKAPHVSAASLEPPRLCTLKKRGLLYKHRVHSWNREDLPRVRAEAESLRKQKHAQIQPKSSGILQAPPVLEEPGKLLSRWQTALSAFASSHES